MIEDMIERQCHQTACHVVDPTLLLNFMTIIMYSPDYQGR